MPVFRVKASICFKASTVCIIVVCSDEAKQVKTMPTVQMKNNMRDAKAVNEAKVFFIFFNGLNSLPLESVDE